MGSGTGNSAVVWGRELRKQNGLLVCFDTWIGDLAMWLSEAWREVMGWQVAPPGQGIVAGGGLLPVPIAFGQILLENPAVLI